MGRWIWTSSRGERLVDPLTPPFPPIHGAHVHGRPTMLILDGCKLMVREVFDCWGIYEEGVGKLGEAWGVVLEDGQRVVVFRSQLHSEWGLARRTP
jgi:hypothetical protein